jgi:hypothetical protein
MVIDGVMNHGLHYRTAHCGGRFIASHALNESKGQRRLPLPFANR